MDVAFYHSPIGMLRIQAANDLIASVSFTDDLPEISILPNGELARCIGQLDEYFSGKRDHFELRMAPEGTSFQQRVWQELHKIPFGKTTSYMDLAKRLGDPKVIRAAARANGKNPIAIIIPCHRVIGSDGGLTGYAGGLERKKWLLEHESAQVSLF